MKSGGRSAAAVEEKLKTRCCCSRAGTGDAVLLQSSRCWRRSIAAVKEELKSGATAVEMSRCLEAEGGRKEVRWIAEGGGIPMEDTQMRKTDQGQEIQKYFLAA